MVIAITDCLLLLALTPSSESSSQLTNGIYLVHEYNARLVVPSVAEHLPNETGTLPNVLVHDGARYHLLKSRRLKKQINADK